MTDAIEWGPAITKGSLAWREDEDRPDWLEGDEPVQVWAGSSGWSPPLPAKQWGFDDGKFRLRADRPAYRAIDAGLRPWGGGDSAPADYPADYAGGRVLMRGDHSGRSMPVSRWLHEGNGGDIIGYEPAAKPDAPAPPADTVLVKRMTEAELGALHAEWLTEPGTKPGLLHWFAKREGILRPEPTREERFTAAHPGVPITDAVRLALGFEK